MKKYTITALPNPSGFLVGLPYLPKRRESQINQFGNPESDSNRRALIQQSQINSLLKKDIQEDQFSLPATVYRISVLPKIFHLNHVQ